MTEDERYLAGLVEHVLFTAPGERINRPDFGSGVRRLVFAPPGDALTETTQALIHGALQTWLGDLIRVETVEVTTLDSRWEVVVTYAPLSAADPEQRHTVTVTGGAP